jgi:uncharacterized delta-60 repeat protein
MALTDIAVLPNGKIVAVGSGVVPNPFNPFINRRNLFIVRYNPNGSLDTTFNGTGKFTSSDGGVETTAQAIAVLPDNKFLVAGYGGGAVKGTVPYKALLYKFSETGLDSTFFNAGEVIIQLPAGNIWSYSVVVLPDGKIITGGQVFTDSAWSLSLFRYKADGTPDSSFGSNGLLTVVDGSLNEAVDVLAQPDGKIIAVTTVGTAPQRDFAVLRFNSDGAPDALFGTNGKVFTAVSPGFDVAMAGALQPDGKILVAGYSSNSGLPVRPALVRYDSKGSLDPTFGVGGIVSAPEHIYLLDVLILSNGKILAGIASGFRVIRYLNNGVRDFDYDGDGKADVSIFRPNAAAEWYWSASSNNQSSGIQFGNGADRIVPADYDGDGKTDIAVFRDGDWYRLNSFDNQFVAAHFGQTGDAPVPADYDGDARADLAVYRTGNWYILNSADNSFRAAQFGISTDKPIIGDFDGDAKSDLAVYRASEGIWYVERSRDGFFGVQFGVSADKPAAADYDGDGKTDVAVYRPADGVWYLLRSHSGFTAMQFGISTDKAVPADYDGDGKSDLAVYRDGNWYVQQSTQGFRSFQFGTATDLPVPNAFVP